MTMTTFAKSIPVLFALQFAKLSLFILTQTIDNPGPTENTHCWSYHSNNRLLNLSANYSTTSLIVIFRQLKRFSVAARFLCNIFINIPPSLCSRCTQWHSRFFLIMTAIFWGFLQQSSTVSFSHFAAAATTAGLLAGVTDYSSSPGVMESNFSTLVIFMFSWNHTSPLIVTVGNQILSFCVIRCLGRLSGHFFFIFFKCKSLKPA